MANWLCSGWEGVHDPPPRKSKKRPQAELLLAAFFFIDSFLQHPLSKLKGYWRKPSIFLSDFLYVTKNLAKKQGLFTKGSYFHGKWQRYFPHGPPPLKIEPWFQTFSFRRRTVEAKKYLGNFSKPESTLQVIPLKLDAGNIGEGVRA